MGVGIFVGLLLVIQLASEGWGVRKRESRLRSDLVELREALAGYEHDHGFYPCTREDHNREGDARIFVRQLTIEPVVGAERQHGLLRIG